MEPLIFAVIIAVFAAIYGGLHFYLYRKLRVVFPSHRRAVISALAILGCSLFVTEIFAHNNFSGVIVVPLSWLTFIWMGLVFLFFVLSAPLDLVQKVAEIAGANVKAVLASPARTIAVAVVVIILAVYGYIAAQQINVVRISLESAKVNNTIRIVQIADLHLGYLSREQHITSIVDIVNALEPDVIVSTGDLVDMQIDHLQELVAQMQRLHAKWGKYAVYGNHEFLAGLAAARDFTERAGFLLLSDTGVTLQSVLNIVGVDDQSIERQKKSTKVDEARLLGQFDNGLFTLLLKHQPVVEQSSIGHFDLQLSGHTHAGQIFPFGLLTWAFYRVPQGFSTVDDAAWIYVSRGTGTWGPPMRIMAPPEITFIEIQPKLSSQ